MVQAAPLRWLFRACKWGLLAGLGYLAILLVGLVPTNNDFHPADDGITVYLVSSLVHADIIVPRTSELVDWSAAFDSDAFLADVSNETHVAFGWGDKGFFLKTSTWGDLTLPVAANVVFIPSPSCMHVSMTRPEYYADAVAVTISADQYRRLAQFIEQSFIRDEAGRFLHIEGVAYSKRDAFYEARGRYHLFNTCNSWVGRALRSAGLQAP